MGEGRCRSSKLRRAGKSLVVVAHPVDWAEVAAAPQAKEMVVQVVVEVKATEA